MINEKKFLHAHRVGRCIMDCPGGIDRDNLRVNERRRRRPHRDLHRQRDALYKRHNNNFVRIESSSLCLSRACLGKKGFC